MAPFSLHSICQAKYWVYYSYQWWGEFYSVAGIAHCILLWCCLSDSLVPAAAAATAAVHLAPGVKGYNMDTEWMRQTRNEKKKKFNVSLIKLYGAIWPVKHMRYVWGLRPCICTHCIVSDRKLCFWYYLCCGSVQSTLYTLYVAASCKSGIGWSAGRRNMCPFWLALLLFGFISILQMYVILDGWLCRNGWHAGLGLDHIYSSEQKYRWHHK